MINTVMRQIAFYCFERKVHEERRSGELTPERLGQIWIEVQADLIVAIAASTSRHDVGGGIFQ